MPTAISTDDMAAWIRPIDEGAMVFLVDACQSAASIDSEGFKPGPIWSAGLGQLAYDKGMLVLAASQSDSAALENGQLEHGFLTCALLVEGLQRELADWKPKDGSITVSEWLAYAAQRVPLMTEDLHSGKLRGYGTPGVRLDRQGRLTQLPSLFDFRRGSALDPLLLRH